MLFVFKWNSFPREKQFSINVYTIPSIDTSTKTIIFLACHAGWWGREHLFHNVLSLACTDVLPGRVGFWSNLSLSVPWPSVIVGLLRSWKPDQFPSTYLGWKPDRHSSMRSVFLKIRPVEAHHTSGQITADVVQHEGSPWSQTRCRRFHRRKSPPWPLTSI